MSTPLTPDWRKPGLVITLYGPPQELDGLASRLTADCGLEAVAERPGLWRSTTEVLWLQVFDPPIPDQVTRVLQIAYNPSDPAAAAGWAAGRTRLEAMLSPAELEAVGGYTLLYLAESDTPLEQTAVDASDLGVARVLHGGRRAYGLHYARLPHGGLWLTQAPSRMAATPAVVYVAVAQPDQEAALNRWLLGRTSPFLMADMTAHKGYAWRRQYDADAELRTTEEALTCLAHDITEILDHLENKQRAATELEEMAHQYDRVVGLIPRLDTIRYNLVRQHINLGQWATGLGAETLFAFHRSQLQMAITELDLLLSRARDTLQAAGTTVGLVQARLTKARTRQERRTEQLLTAVGLALALPELITPAAANAFLGWLSRWVGVVVAPTGGYTEGVLFWTQVGLIVAVGALFWALARHLLWRR